MTTLRKVWLNCIQLLTLITISVSASAQLKADFSANPQVGCPPMVVTFEDKTTGNPTEWKWDLGNGTISYLQDPIATYFNTGTYTIKLLVKNSAGTEVFVRTNGMFTHTESTLVKSALTNPTWIISFLTVVSEQPELLSAISFTV